MIQKVLFIALTLFSVAFTKTVPSALMGHKDVPDSSFGNPIYSTKILVASRKSEFKNRLAYTVADSLSADSIYVEVSGVKKLKNLDIEKYSAIIIINRCLSWQIDNKVQDFFKDYPNYKKVVLVTTSGDPKGCGKGRHVPDYVDAISSASVDENFGSEVNEILLNVRKFVP